MRAKGNIPLRKCISCGARRPKNDLVRLVIDCENRLIRDKLRRINGRGAYICEQKSCLDRLLANKRLGRHFRSDRNISISDELIDMTFDNK